MIHSIKTIKKFHEEKLKEKGSIFIGQVYPVNSENEIKNILEEVKKKYFDATHHCFAYRFSEDKFKYSDAGEPSGTAGIRILNAIDHFNLKNIIVIIIRYFGGTKLGVGLLGKTYYNCAKSVLENSEFLEKKIYKKVTINFEFSLISHVQKILSSFSAKFEKSNYNENAEIICFLLIKDLDQVKKQLIDISKGRIKFSEDKNIFFL